MLEITCSSPVVINNVDAILGTDGCIYWPPHSFEDNRAVLQFDPVALNDQALPVRVRDDLGRVNFEWWSSGALALNGKIYYIPFNLNQVLCIDPFKIEIR